MYRADGRVRVVEVADPRNEGEIHRHLEDVASLPHGHSNHTVSLPIDDGVSIDGHAQVGEPLVHAVLDRTRTTRLHVPSDIGHEEPEGAAAHQELIEMVERTR